MSQIITTIAASVVTVLIFTAIVILAARTMKTWAAGLHELRQDMHKIGSEIDEIKKQLSDITARLG